MIISAVDGNQMAWEAIEAQVITLVVVGSQMVRAAIEVQVTTLVVVGSQTVWGVTVALAIISAAAIRDGKRLARYIQ